MLCGLAITLNESKSGSRETNLVVAAEIQEKNMEMAEGMEGSRGVLDASRVEGQDLVTDWIRALRDGRSKG